MKGNKVNHAAALDKANAERQYKWEHRFDEPERPKRHARKVGTMAGIPDHERRGNARTAKFANASLNASVNPAKTNVAVEKAVRKHAKEKGLFIYGNGKMRKA